MPERIRARLRSASRALAAGALLAVLPLPGATQAAAPPIAGSRFMVVGAICVRR